MDGNARKASLRLTARMYQSSSGDLIPELDGTGSYEVSPSGLCVGITRTEFAACVRYSECFAPLNSVHAVE